MHIPLAHHGRKHVVSGSNSTTTSLFLTKSFLIPQFFICWFCVLVLFFHFSLYWFDHPNDVRVGGHTYYPRSGPSANHNTTVIDKPCTEVDLVYLWVNGSDPKVIADIAKHAPGRVGASRVRDYGTLKYSIRSAEKYANWVRNIVIITSGEKPNWLNLNSSRLIFLTHKQFFNNNTVNSLPTFNSNSIETQFYNLPNSVSDCILYLNDDFFFYAPTHLSDFYDTKKKAQVLNWSGFVAPEKPEKLSNIWHYAVSVTDNRLLNEWYHKDLLDANANERDDPRLRHKYAGHFAYFFQRGILKELYRRWSNESDETSRRKFRDSHDFVLSFMYYNVAVYDYGAINHPGLKTFYGAIETNHEKNEKMLNRLKSRKPKLVCINDALGDDKNQAGETPEGQMTRFFEEFLPDKSSVEIGYKGEVGKGTLSNTGGELVADEDDELRIVKGLISWFLVALICFDVLWITYLVYYKKNKRVGTRRL
eukprot:TRINITY_DN14851_c0_g1_i1.p1 TRINITY_DN14851_c0_g1~~TRINITY_DN14851_c0_g1_i1.p1  ORF type:complete len:477 (+),score=79.58 TRINITY_DN14851_c0_g1_i1:51-1481(+)